MEFYETCVTEQSHLYLVKVLRRRQKKNAFLKRNFPFSYLVQRRTKKGLLKEMMKIVEVRAIDLEPQAFIWNAVL